MKAMAVLASCVVVLAAEASCGGGGGGGGGGEPAPAFTNDDRAAILDEAMTATSSITTAVATSLLFVPQVRTSSTTQTVRPRQASGSLSCSTDSGTCSCTYGGEVVHCHVTIDEQELCSFSGSQWLTGSIDATGAPNIATLDGNATLKLGPPPCVVSTDGLTLDGTLVATISAQSAGETFHMLYRLFSNGITATRAGKEVGVCIVDITVTEAGASGTLCGDAWPPKLP